MIQAPPSNVIDFQAVLDAKRKDGPQSKAHTGGASELKAAAWLLEHGLEVFRNVSACGPVDLVALDRVSGHVTLYDVKTVVAIGANPRHLKPGQIALGVRALYVLPNETIVSPLPGDDSAVKPLSTKRDWLLVQSDMH